jgi:phosphonate transport system substrate-binding protein
MVSAEATFSTYRRLVEKVAGCIGREAAFILRPSYADVRRALEQGRVDVAFVCTGTYIHAMPGGKIRLLVQPEFENGLQYRSLLIVPAGSSAEQLADLRGATMAFTDPESNTGCLVPSVTLARQGSDPASFFGRVVFTGSHDRSIQSVALGLVDAAAVDALIWESLKLEDRSLDARVRVIWASEVFGPPPIVVPEGLDKELENSLGKALLTLHEDEEGQRILHAIGIKRFVPAREEDYRTAIQLMADMRGGEAAR